MAKNVWSANFGNDGFILDFFSESDESQKAFLAKLESGFKQNIIEKILSTDKTRSNFNYIKSSGPLHSHNHYEIDLVIAGEIEESDGITVNRLRVNDAVFVSPYNYHSYTKISEDAGYTVLLNISLQKDFFGNRFKYICGYNFPQHFTLSDEEVETILNLLIFTYNRNAEGEDDARALLAEKTVEIIVSIMMLHLRERENTVVNKNYSNIINTIIFINENFSQKITCNTVAKICGYSPNYFSASFKKIMGISFSEYLLKVRLERAKYMLSADSVSVADICDACGFSSVSYFSKLFKEQFGESPNHFRKVKVQDVK